MTAEELQEYGQGDPVRLPVRVKDPSGVRSVYAYAYREGKGPGAIPPATQEDQIYLSGDPPAQQGSAPVDVVLRGMVSTQDPGVFTCEQITAEDTWENSKTTLLDSPRRFRIVEGPQDREGPEVLEVGEFLNTDT